MKATELMIGDWVSISPYGIIDKVDCLLTEYAITSNGGYPCGQNEYKDIEPILLTPDILKKNGFELVSDSDRSKALVEIYDLWECKTISQTLYVHYYKKRKDYSIHSAYCIINHIVYVHELQNAMRVCGVEKEIEL